jgi:TolB-like protein
MSNPKDRPSGLGQFVAELRRRHVVRFSIGYAAAAFVVLQLAEIVFPAFGIGESGLRLLVVAVALLFPPALVVAWVFDITAEGIKRTQDLPPAETDRRRGNLTPRLALLAFTLAIVGGLGAWMAREGVLDPARPERHRGTGGERGESGPQAVPELVAYDPNAPIRSLAVLPLENFSETEEQDYFSAGMHEELIAQLSQIAGLRVVSRTSVLRFAGTSVPIPRIGSELQVDAVIEGSIRRDGDQVRITVQLIHAASDTHVWTKQYDRPLEDILALQSEVALDIAEQVEAELSAEEADMLERTASREVDPEAQDAYLRGKFEYGKGTPEGYQAALGHFQEAVREDSAFAPAMAGLAGTRFLMGMSVPEVGDSAIARALTEAEHALEMDSTSAEAREVVALIRSMGTPPPTPPDVPATGAVLPEVPGLDTAWIAAVTQMGRRIEDQIRRRAVTSDRTGRTHRISAARQLMASGLFSEAAGLLAQVVDDEPGLDPAWELLAHARVSAGDVEGAVDAVAEWAAAGGDGAPASGDVAALTAAVATGGPRGYWSSVLDRLDAGREAGAPVPMTDYAAAQAGSGDREGALASLREALQHRERGLLTLHSDPVWDGLRGDPRFIEIARRVRVIRP